jgi:hypothetical protein
LLLLAPVEAALEAGANADALALLAWLAGREVELDADAAQGALRRAVLLLAAGGDPRRGPDLDSRAVTALAAELDTPERRTALAAGIVRLRGEAAGFARVSEALGALDADPELAWRAFACGLLAEELGEDE